METTMNEILPDRAAPVDGTPQPDTVSRPASRTGRPGDDVVRWAEFRLALWIGGFALAVIISGQGLLFSAILDLKGDIGVLRAEMQTQNGVLRAEMQTQNGVLRAEMQTQINDLRTEMQAQINDLRTEMQAQINDLRTEMQAQFAELRERIVRIETHLGVDAAAADKGS